VSLHDERMQILGMIQSGQVSAEEGAKLLAALKAGDKESGAPDGTQPRWFRVRVTDRRSGKNKVSVNIPMALVNVGIRMGARFVPDAEGVDYNALRTAIQSGAQGKIMDVDDERTEERVEIWLE